MNTDTPAPAPVQELLGALDKLSEKDRRRLARALENQDLPLSDQERAFVSEYTEHFDAEAAGFEVGLGPGAGKRFMQAPAHSNVQRAVAEKQQERDGDSRLNAQYAKEYLYGLMELCPIDYFELGPDGDYYIDPGEMKKLPREVKRYIEGVELRRTKYGDFYTVKFVSKTAAMAIAARYTLTQKLEAAVLTAQVPWSQVAAAVGRKELDEVERRIADAAALGAKGPVRADTGAVA